MKPSKATTSPEKTKENTSPKKKKEKEESKKEEDSDEGSDSDGLSEMRQQLKIKESKVNAEVELILADVQFDYRTGDSVDIY